MPPGRLPLEVSTQNMLEGLVYISSGQGTPREEELENVAGVRGHLDHFA